MESGVRPHSKLQVRPPRRPLPPFTSTATEDGFEVPVAPALRGSQVRRPDRSFGFIFILRPCAATTTTEEGRKAGCIVPAKETGVRPQPVLVLLLCAVSAGNGRPSSVATVDRPARRQEAASAPPPLPPPRASPTRFTPNWYQSLENRDVLSNQDLEP